MRRNPKGPALASKAPRAVWARTALRVWPELYRIVSLPPSLLREAAALLARGGGSFAALVLERDEVSLTLREDVFAGSPLRGRARATSPPYRAITLDAEVDLDVCGYLAPAATRLAEAGVPIVPQCAFARDHLLVPARDRKRAVRVLQDWIRDCRLPARTTAPEASRGRRRPWARG
jgi:hypothetical protein